MQRLKKTIKRMAAVGTGIAMLGATMTGALAQDLANYPQPFVDANGLFNDNTAIVVGADAAASDTLGAVDIAQRLQFDAKTPVSGGDGTVTVSGGVTEDVPLGMAIANDTSFALDQELDDSDIESFIDTEISFASDKFKVHDALLLKGASPAVHTSITSSDDDYETNIFLETSAGAMQYYMVFDETIQPNQSSSDDPLEFKFLGKNLKITAIDSTNAAKFTATVGAEFFMDAGDTVTVDGKKVTLVNVGEGGAIVVDVDGVLETISASNTKTINGLEIKNEETFYTNEKSERSASLIIGEDAVKTYTDGDEFVGEDEDDPDWIWNVGNLNSNAATTNLNSSADPQGPFIGILNDFVKTADTHDPPGVGECYDLPNNYVSVCLDSLTVADDDYLEITMEYLSSVQTDKSKFDEGKSEAKVISISAPGDDRFVLKSTGWSHSNGTVNNKKTSQVYLQASGIADDNVTYLFYEDSDQNPSLVYGGNVTLSQTVIGNNDTATNILELNFGDTKDNNAVLSIINNTASVYALSWNFTGDSSSELLSGDDRIVTLWTQSSNQFDRLGATASEEESAEVMWHTLSGNDWTAGYTNLGKKDEDQRTPYGVIVKDPKSNGGSDQVILEVPGDHVQANIVVKGATTSVSGGSTSFIPANIDITTRLDSEVSGSESNFDLILVGGPCANDAVEAVSGLGVSCSGWSLGPGEGLLKFAANGDNVALLVAGTNAIDTRTSAKVLKNYDQYTLSGSEAGVSGTPTNPVVA